MAGIATDLTVFNKVGVVTTNANGIANVVFRIAQPHDFQYVVLLTCYNSGIGYGAYSTNITQTGFTINTWVIGGAGSMAPGITVHWAVRSVYND
jgi:hypothetical protein